MVALPYLYIRARDTHHARMFLGEVIHVLLENLQLVTNGDEGIQYVTAPFHSLTVAVHVFTRSSQFEASNLHQVVDNLQLLDILHGILAHIVGRRHLRAQMGKLFLPIAQQTLAHVELSSNFLNGIIQFQVLVLVQWHDILLFVAKVTKKRVKCKRKTCFSSHFRVPRTSAKPEDVIFAA